MRAYNVFEQRERELRAVEQMEYERKVKHWDLGWEDGEAGRDDRTAEMDTYADDYGSGYETGRAEHTKLSELGYQRCDRCEEWVYALSSAGRCDSCEESP